MTTYDSPVDRVEAWLDAYAKLSGGGGNHPEEAHTAWVGNADEPAVLRVSDLRTLVAAVRSGEGRPDMAALIATDPALDAKGQGAIGLLYGVLIDEAAKARETAGQAVRDQRDVCMQADLAAGRGVCGLFRPCPKHDGDDMAATT